MKKYLHVSFTLLFLAGVQNPWASSVVEPEEGDKPTATPVPVATTADHVKDDEKKEVTEDPSSKDAGNEPTKEAAKDKGGDTAGKKKRRGCTIF